MSTKHVIGKDEPGLKVLLMGNEAIARGAIEAGVQVAASYPGTPATEIMETLTTVAKELNFHAEWSVNEKVAFEVAVGAALVGRRGLAAMKNAGVNWCMDMLCTVTYGGVRGGLVLVVADDPGARTSSNAQDLRFASISAETLCLEPSTQQEAKDMTREAFRMSETLELPVIVRTVARISHSLGDVTFGKLEKSVREAIFDKHWQMPFRWNVYGPPSTHSKHVWLHSRMQIMKRFVEESDFNRLELRNPEMGVIASGIASVYVEETLHRMGAQERVSFLKIGTSYPLPESKVRAFLKDAKKVAVVEDGEPFVETQLKAIAKDVAPDVEIYGKSSACGRSILPIPAELTPELVAEAMTSFLGLVSKPMSPERKKVKDEVSKLVVPRSSTFCAGCPHIGTWAAITKALRNKGISGDFPVINGDIGCYELAGYGLFAKNLEPSSASASVCYKTDNPYELIDTNYIMGGGVGISQGMYHAGYKDGRILAVAGDSTFFHACIPALINAVFNKAKLTFVVMDNSWTAMTGHQPHPGTGITAIGDPASSVKIEDICKASGVDFVKVVDPYDLRATTDAVKEALLQQSVSVVISRRLCAHEWLREMKKDRVRPDTYEVDPEKCAGCRICVRLGCPGLMFDEKSMKAKIDTSLCIGCGLCSQECSVKAIAKRSKDR